MSSMLYLEQWNVLYTRVFRKIFKLPYMEDLVLVRRRRLLFPGDAVWAAQCTTHIPNNDGQSSLRYKQPATKRMSKPSLA